MPDFSKTTQLRDRLGTPIPQVWNGEEFVPLTASMLGGGGSNSNIHVSTELPTDDVGKDGDLWIKYSEVNG